MSIENAMHNAEHFIQHEKAFHLGFLPTEQSSSLTKNLDKIFAESCEGGVQALQKVIVMDFGLGHFDEPSHRLYRVYEHVHLHSPFFLAVSLGVAPDAP